jgi:hypothetical protein
MSRRSSMKTLRTGSAARQMAMGNVKPMLTDMQAGNEERVKLYHSQRLAARSPSVPDEASTLQAMRGARRHSGCERR